MLSTALLLLASMAVGQAEAKVPPKMLEEIGLLAGQWEFEGNFQGQSFKGTSWRWWAPKKTCLMMDWTADMGVGTGIRGLDSATGEIVETWYTTIGERIEYRYRVVSDTIREGTMVVSSPPDKVEKGTIRLEMTSPNLYTFEAKSDTTSFIEKGRRVRRLEQASPTAKVEVKELEAFVGAWEGKDKKGNTTKWSFAWNRDGTLLENEANSTDAKGKQMFFMKGALAWDEGELRVSNRGFSKQGGPMVFDWAKSGEKTWQTWGRGSTGKNKVELIDKDTWKFGSGENETIFIRQPTD